MVYILLQQTDAEHKVWRMQLIGLPAPAISEAFQLATKHIQDKKRHICFPDRGHCVEQIAAADAQVVKIHSQMSVGDYAVVGCLTLVSLGWFTYCSIKC
ncbi:hypothetical protein WJX84_005801 [Apatococcus fuscideae]|uniref:Uncharacterized protein n=1 Tax=Apatococcus fuscideae TaxID=2026836 RepID=A0AAW1T7T7_9CHLO